MKNYSEEAFNKWLLQTSDQWEDVRNVVAMTGFSTIDNDHKQLLRYILKLNEIVEHFKNNDIDLTNLDQEKELFYDFWNYTKYHFAKEEEILTNFKMTDLEKQQSQHVLILDKIKDAIKGFEAGKIMVTGKFKMEILDWVIDHINNIDKNSFRLANFSKSIAEAKSWDEISTLVENTGLGFVDSEHRDITKALFSFFNNMELNKDSHKLKLEFGLGRLLIIFNDHFNHEEEFIKKYKLKNSALQRKSHAYFIKRLETLMAQDPEQSGKLNVYQLKEEILTWWIGHINGIDHETFALEEWAKGVVQQAKVAEDITWLIQKTGIPVIDTDHENFIKKSMEVFAVLDTDNDENDLIQKFTELHIIVKSHFKHEESIMEDMKDFNSEYHKAEHDRILGFMGKTLEHLKSGRMGLDNNFKLKIIDWWIHHTNYIDVKTFGFK